MTLEEARKEFRRGLYVSNYASFFGQKPKNLEALDSLKFKKFSDLDFVAVLKPEIIEIVQKYLDINDDDDHTSKLYTIVRDMHTVVKNQ